jgi:hypothetical protein
MPRLGPKVKYYCHQKGKAYTYLAFKGNMLIAMPGSYCMISENGGVYIEIRLGMYKTFLSFKDSRFIGTAPLVN